VIIKLQWLPGNGHYRCSIFVGKDRDHMALAGAMMLHPDEAAIYRQTVRMGIQQGGFDGILESGWREPGKTEEENP
jgi:hypothetical protein